MLWNGLAYCEGMYNLYYYETKFDYEVGVINFAYIKENLVK